MLIPRRSLLRGGFTLVEVILVVSVVGILAISVLPHAIAARIRANEISAMETLRQVHLQQMQLGLLPLIDRDSDGRGEFGFLGEEVLDYGLTKVEPGILEKAGYYFEVWLPSEEGHGVSKSTVDEGQVVLPDPDRAELYWCCYAWPVRAGMTGKNVFFINQNGDMFRRGTSAEIVVPTPPAKAESAS